MLTLTTVEDEYDVIFIGGGLASCLKSLSLSLMAPHLRWLVLEKESAFLSDRTWSFHESEWLDFVSHFKDVSALEAIKNLPDYYWPQQRVVFDTYERTLEAGYFTIRANSLNRKYLSMFSSSVLFNAQVSSVNRLEHKTHVTLQSGALMRRVSCSKIYDTRPLSLNTPNQDCGYQKFLGQVVRTPQSFPFGAIPIIKDTRVAQLEGYRFIYVLPFDAHTTLIEDTRYADTPNIDTAAYRIEIARYLKEHGVAHYTVEHEESAALPIPLKNLYRSVLHTQPEAFGMAASNFHYVTGYSMPYLIKSIVRDVHQVHCSWIERLRTQFYLALNRMLFFAAEPQDRLAIFRRFYRLPKGLIARFYAGKTTIFDAVRILVGRPPVSIAKAVKALLRF